MVLSKGQNDFVADVSKNFASVLFAGAFASELILKLNLWTRVAMIAGMLLFLVIGLWASRNGKDGGP